MPVDEAIQFADDRLYSGDVKAPPVDKQTFIKLTELASKNVLMWTPDGYYRQIV